MTLLSAQNYPPGCQASCKLYVLLQVPFHYHNVYNRTPHWCVLNLPQFASAPYLLLIIKRRYDNSTILQDYHILGWDAMWSGRKGHIARGTAICCNAQHSSN
jgi:hypothetical protein